MPCLRIYVSCLAVVTISLTLGACLGGSEEGARALEAALERALPPREVRRPSLWPEGHLQVTGLYELRRGEERWTVRIEREAWVDGADRMRVVDRRLWSSHETPPGDGVEAEEREDRFEGLLDGERWLTRRNHGPWIARDASDGHPQAVHARLRDWLPALYRAFEGHLARVPTADPVATLGDRSATWHRLGLHPFAGASTVGADLAALRDDEAEWPTYVASSHRPGKVEGRLAFATDAPDEPVAGDIAITGTVTTAEGVWTFRAMGEHRWTPSLGGEAFTPPDAWLPERRPRVWPMIREVLGDSLREVWGGPAL